jgi:glutamate racemase
LERVRGAGPIVDSADATAEDVVGFLAERGLTARGPGSGSLQLYVTDMPRSFTDVAARFLGHPVSDVRAIDL